MNIENQVKQTSDFLKPLLDVCVETSQPEWKEFYRGCASFLKDNGYLSPKQKARMKQQLKFTMLRAGIDV